MDDKVVDIILKSMEKMSDKLNSLQGIPPLCASRGEELRRIIDTQEKMGEILHRNTDSLEDHIRRTELLEIELAKTDKRIGPIEVDFWRKKHINFFVKKVARWGVAILSIAGTLVGIFIGVEKFLK